MKPIISSGTKAEDLRAMDDGIAKMPVHASDITDGPIFEGQEKEPQTSCAARNA